MKKVIRKILYLNSSFLINSTIISFSGQICNILSIKHKNGDGRIFPPQTPPIYFSSTALSTTNSAKHTKQLYLKSNRSLVSYQLEQNNLLSNIDNHIFEIE